ncbi:hypothetical protein ACLB2K_012577 [Fragaria x ananassa]
MVSEGRLLQTEAYPIPLLLSRHRFRPRPNITPSGSITQVKPSLTLFGQVNIFDNPLTKEPEITSERLGVAQGLYSFSSQEEYSVLLAMTIVFTSGTNNDSSVTILGRNPVLQPRREFPIVGGTGDFRLARGFATASNYVANASMAIVEYNVTSHRAWLELRGGDRSSSSDVLVEIAGGGRFSRRGDFKHARELPVKQPPEPGFQKLN